MRPYKVGQQVYVKASDIKFGEYLKIVDGKCKVMGYDADGWLWLEVNDPISFGDDLGLYIAPREMKFLKPVED